MRARRSTLPVGNLFRLKAKDTATTSILARPGFASGDRLLELRAGYRVAVEQHRQKEQRATTPGSKPDRRCWLIALPVGSLLLKFERGRAARWLVGGGASAATASARTARERRNGIRKTSGEASHDYRCAVEGCVPVRRLERGAARRIREDRRSDVASRELHDFCRRRRGDRALSHSGWHGAPYEIVARREDDRGRDARIRFAFRGDAADRRR